MKIFISWSGEQSRIIAEGLNNWLPKVIQAVKPFYSPEIEKGTKGIEEINKTLEGTSFGIICLTPDNLNSTWIHYEAGALSKIEGARIWTLLHNLKHSDIVQPLAQFQHTLAKKEDIYKLLDSINAKLIEPLEKSVLRDSFDRWWPDFEEILERSEQAVDNKRGKDNQESKNIRSEREILDEILEILRNQQRFSIRDITGFTPIKFKAHTVQIDSYYQTVYLKLSLSRHMISEELDGAEWHLRNTFSDSKIERIVNDGEYYYKLVFAPPIHGEELSKGIENINTTSNFLFEPTLKYKKN